MSISIVYSRAGLGIHAPLVTIEVHLSHGLPAFQIVGLPEAAVRESRERVRSAILQSEFEFPAKRITVNLAPADLPKQGSRFDLAIAIGILGASRQIKQTSFDSIEIMGELALTGELRGVEGVLPFALATAAVERTLILPLENSQEASFVSNLRVLAAKHIKQICDYFINGEGLTFQPAPQLDSVIDTGPDMADVKGQRHAKFALEVAAAGGHSLIMVGPPGTGKTMLASRLPGLLPPMSEKEAIESATVLSVSGKKLNHAIWRRRPFRSPHHTASSVALVGGGRPPMPGEISLSHRGVLFLDELPEFSRNVLETLREPLESGVVTISRAGQQQDFPAEFQLICAMNPCPCGHWGNPKGQCRCTKEQVARYYNRISGPLLDRIDLQIEVAMLNASDYLRNADKEETSEQVRTRIMAARSIQLERNGCLNAKISGKVFARACALDRESVQLMEDAIDRLGLSMRSHHRILRVARTLADLAGVERMQSAHIKCALSLRSLERNMARLEKS